MNKKPLCLIILDGFGWSDKATHNAILNAKTPTLDYLLQHYPHTTLHASGTYVGLLPGMIGNSEVGHQTIGAGRIVTQPITQMNEHLYEKLTTVFNEQTKTIHIMTLLSDAGIHSHTTHLFDAINAALAHECNVIYIHVFLDGRDTLPMYATRYLQQLNEYIKEYDHVILASIHGRWYAMDRDNNNDRTKKSFDILTKPQKKEFADWSSALNYYYAKGITDEYIVPTQLETGGIIQKGHTVVCLNFRSDRIRQLTKMILDNTNASVNQFITPICYGKNIYTTVLFEQKPLSHTLKEIVSKQGKKILSIAETEKYAHITYFLGGGQEKPFVGETQVLIPSLSVKNYIQHPQMSAKKITEHVTDALYKNKYDLYIINYANADMVGHSGDMQATIKAIEYLDIHIKQLYTACVLHNNGTCIITADHGKAEDMFDEIALQPRTAHTKNKVPFIVVKESLKDTKQHLNIKSLAEIKDFIIALK